MKRFAVVSVILFAFAAFIGCRGSVDRVYDDGVLPVAEAGGPGAADAPSGSSSGGEGGLNKKDFDAATDGPPPNTAPAQVIGVVIGLIGTGLVLQDNGGDDLEIKADGAFSFTTPVAPGQPYDVKVTNQPAGPTQTCTVSNGSGMAKGVDIIDIKVTCATSTYPVGGTVVGLGAGPIMGLALQNNGGNDISPTGDGAFTFPNVPSGASFNVVVKTSPAGRTCNVSGGTGTVVTAGVDSVVVNCGANTYTVGGTVTGLAGTIIVQNNLSNDRTVSANGSFAFSIPISSGAGYAVSVKTQPAYPPVTQSCVVTKGMGTVTSANVTDVAITCTTNKYTIGGTVTGLAAGGSFKLQNKGTDDKIVAQNGSFTFATSLPSATSYTVTAITQPQGQTCAVTNSGGTIASGNVTNVIVNCASAVVLSENFDSVKDPTLPSGWTTTVLNPGGAGIQGPWITVSDAPDRLSAPNSAFIEDTIKPRDIALDSPAFNVASATAKLAFWNHYNLEDQWDGGVLEISLDGGAFVDILAAGGAFTANGYNRTLLNDQTNPIGGRQAWTGDHTFVTTVNLPASAAGHSVVLRWRFGSDDGAAENGWWIDDVVVTN